MLRIYELAEYNLVNISLRGGRTQDDIVFVCLRLQDPLLRCSDPGVHGASIKRVSSLDLLSSVLPAYT
jgi:hypothetical protein